MRPRKVSASVEDVEFRWKKWTGAPARSPMRRASVIASGSVPFMVRAWFAKMPPAAAASATMAASSSVDM